MPHTTPAKSQQKSAPRRRIAARVVLKPGASPGATVPLAGSSPATVAVLHAASGQACTVTPLASLKNLPAPSPKGVNWVRVTGLGSLDPLLTIAERYSISRLALEDTLSPGWRTKLEMQGEYAFFVLQGAPDPVTRTRGDHLTLFCKPGLILTFEDTPTTIVSALWTRLQAEPMLIATPHMAEMLTYMVLDMMVDGFFPHLDQKDEALADLEERISDHVPRRMELNRLHQVKRDLITLRRLLTPFRELRTEIQKYHTPESLKDLRPFFSDLADHVLQAGELLDTYYEVAESLDDISERALSNRMNDIVRILTIISTVFMPLSFIAGVYGMNFDTSHPLNMPELSLPYGYILVLLGMGGIVCGMLWFFKRKGWL